MSADNKEMEEEISFSPPHQKNNNIINNNNTSSDRKRKNVCLFFFYQVNVKEWEPSSLRRTVRSLVCLS